MSHVDHRHQIKLFQIVFFFQIQDHLIHINSNENILPRGLTNINSLSKNLIVADLVFVKSRSNIFLSEDAQFISNTYAFTSYETKTSTQVCGLTLIFSHTRRCLWDSSTILTELIQVTVNSCRMLRSALEKPIYSSWNNSPICLTKVF